MATRLVMGVSGFPLQATPEVIAVSTSSVQSTVIGVAFIILTCEGGDVWFTWGINPTATNQHFLLRDGGILPFAMADEDHKLAFVRTSADCTVKIFRAIEV